MEKNKLKMKTEIIAEIANAHQGNPQLAKKLAKYAINSGADAVKFQIYFAEELLSKKHPRFNHFKKQSFSKETWIKMIKSLKNTKVKIYCDVFGEKAFKVAKICNVDGYKIHSSDLNNYILLNLVAKANKKIFLSIGGSTLEEVAYALNILKKYELKNKPIILHGFQSYPTKINNCDLFKIKMYKKIFGNKCELGYQDHISAENPLNYITPIIAKNFGAKYLEKHITVDRKKKGVDYYSSLEPSEFKKFVNLVKDSKQNYLLGVKKKNYQLAIGNKNLEEISEAENMYREQVKKAWFVRKNITKGNKINKHDLIMKRPADKNTNNIFWERFKNKKTIINVDTKNNINNSMFKNDITAIIVARNNSRRLKKKAIKKICDIPTIVHLIKRVKKSKKVKRIILCTTKKKEDDILEKIAKINKILCFRGSDKNVLGRMLSSIKEIKTDIVVRITGDDILIDPHYLDKTIDYHLKNNLQYTDAKSLPSGIDTEIFDRTFLETINKLAEDTSGTEYLTYYVSDHKNQFKIGSLNVKDTYRKKIRLTLDNNKDFKVINTFLEEMNLNKKLFNYTFNDLKYFYKNNKKLFNLNQSKSKKIEKINTRFFWKKLFN